MSTTATLPIPEISDLDVVFGADALKWMPAWDDIPKDFQNMNGRTEWNRIVSRWFFSGLPASTEFHPREGVDPPAALRVIKATLGSYAPKHEHKEAAVAYMLSCWFTKITGWDKR